MSRDDKPKNPHLWIPESEVESLPHDPTGREKQRNIHHTEHGDYLIHALQSIEQIHQKRKTPLSDEVVVFKVTLSEGQKFQNRQRQQNLGNHGINLLAVKNQNTAVVSTTTRQFQNLKSRVESYRTRKAYPDLQFIESFESFSRQDKQSEDIKRLLSQDVLMEERVDIQMLLTPNLTKGFYEKALPFLISRIHEEHGELVRSPYYLSDQTPVIRAILPASAINTISEEEILFRIEQTNFFKDGEEENQAIDITSIPLNPQVDIDQLPIVVILDNGIRFPANLETLMIDRIQLPEILNPTCLHGTQVASRAIFGDSIDAQVRMGQLTPRVRVIDACISDGRSAIPEDTMIARIQHAVQQLSGISKVFNLSMNARRPIDGDSISILAYELDNLMRNYNVQFVISAGNHSVWVTADDFGEIVDDDDSQIASPADSVLGLTIGAISRAGHPQCLTQENQLSPFSRIGPGFSNTTKPDFVAPGGNIFLDKRGNESIPDEVAAHVISPDGKLGPSCGTSFSAPIVAGDYAHVLAALPSEDILLAKTLLIHTARPLWDSEELNEEEQESIGRLYGNGLTDPERAILSTDSSVTFITTGQLNRLTKQRVKFYMPDALAAQAGRNTARVTVTCVTAPPLDRTKGTEYLGAYVSASLKKINTKNMLAVANPAGGEGREKWHSYQHFTKLFSSFNPGDWQIWLQLYSRWDVSDTLNINYALAVTVEDPSGQINVYEHIQNEVGSRFTPMTSVRLRTSF
ncbi:S8 family peptidase [Paenibacillus oryzisoli]|uniref:S8 family peptidase n=1 Tax=Paenibacillus oryzisoli TaxID=1850517 RepID=UPI003D291C69